MDVRRLVGTNFARLRRERGLTQEQVEERSGFSQQYLSGLERGQRNPTLATLQQVARALGVGTLDLLEGIDMVEPDVRRDGAGTGPER